MLFGASDADLNQCPYCFQLEEQGVEILMKEERQMTKEEAAAFYKQHEGSVSTACTSTCVE